MADTAPYWAHVLRTLYQDVPESFYPYQASAFLGVLLVLALPVALSGAVLPLMFHALRDRVGDLGEWPAGSTAGTPWARCSAR